MRSPSDRTSLRLFDSRVVRKFNISVFGLNLNKEMGMEKVLIDLRRGEEAIIGTLPSDEELRSQCIRLGLAPGSTISCIERLPGGTVVLQSARQEIALGRSLAERISLRPDPSTGSNE